MTQKTNPWTFDVRVRERNLKAGSLTDKDVEKYLGSLPDNADQSEAFATAQPALEQPEIVDDVDDEDDDMDDEGDVGGEGDGDGGGGANGVPAGGGPGGDGGGGEGT